MQTLGNGTYVWVNIVGVFTVNDENRNVIDGRYVNIQRKRETIDHLLHFLEDFSGGFAIYKIINNENLHTIYSSSTSCDFFRKNLATFADDADATTKNLRYTEDLSSLHSLLYKAFRYEENISFNFCVTPPHQAQKWMNASIKKHKNCHGENLLYVTYLNLADDKIIENDLQQSNNTLDDNTFVCDYNEEWSIKRGNPSFYIELGYTELEITNTFSNSFLAMTHHESKKDLLKTINAQLKNSNRFSAQVCLKDKTGSLLYFLMIGELTTYKNDKYLDFSLINISTIQNQELNLKTIKNDITQLYNNAPDAIMRCATTEPCTIKFANEHFYELIGYSKEEFSTLYHNNIINIMHPADISRMKNLLDACPQHRDYFSVSCRIYAKNLATKWLTISGTFIINKYGTQSLYCTCKDTTEHYEMLNELTLMRERMNIVVKDLDLRYWDFSPSEDSIQFTDNIFQKNVRNWHKNSLESIIGQGFIDELSIEKFRNMHEKIKAGEPFVKEALLCAFAANEKKKWRNIRYTTLFDDNGCPILAIGTGEDISEFKEIEHKLTVIASQISIDIWTYNIDTKTITQEGNFIQVGVHDKAIRDIPESIIELGLVHEDDIPIYRDIYTQLENGISQISREIRAKTINDSEYKWIKLSYTALENKEGQARVAFGSALDISEQKSAEAHYEDEMRLWSTETNESVMSCIINISSNVVLSGSENNFGIEIANKDAQGLLDLLASKIVNEDEKKSYSQIFTIKNLTHLFNSGTHAQSSKLLLLHNKKSMWVSFSIAMIKNSKQADIIGFISIDDITEEKLSQDFAQEFVANQFDFILRLNYEEDTHQIFYASQASKLLDNNLLTGKYQTDIKTVLASVIVKEDLPQILQEFSVNHLLKRSTSEGRYTFYSRVKRDNGSNRFKSFRVFQRNDVTKNICIGCVDITEMHRQEQEHVDTLREALTVARQAIASKSTFLASMSHDIRTPMNAIMGMTHLALEDQKKP